MNKSDKYADILVVKKKKYKISMTGIKEVT